jgi:phosphatidylglycerol lysyltransferase
MYSVRGRSWIAFGDPIGAEPDREELAWQFRELVDRYDGWSVFYQVCETNLAVYLDLGLTLLQLGEEGRVPLEQFSLEGSARAGLRYTHHRFQRDGWTFDVVAHDAMSAILRDVKAISDAWLAEKASREQGFSLGFFNEAYLRHFPCAVVRYAGKLTAFANIWQGAEREELSIDLMRYRPGAPSGVMEFLFVELMLWGKAQGYRWFSLGMAPLSGIEDGPLAPLWNKVVGLAFRHGEHFDSGLGLREYKQKFDPVWTPRYLASPGGLVLPQILADIAVLINRPGESTVNAKVAVPAREEP